MSISSQICIIERPREKIGMQLNSELHLLFELKIFGTQSTHKSKCYKQGRIPIPIYSYLQDLLLKLELKPRLNRYKS